MRYNLKHSGFGNGQTWAQVLVLPLINSVTFVRFLNLSDFLFICLSMGKTTFTLLCCCCCWRSHITHGPIFGTWWACNKCQLLLFQGLKYRPLVKLLAQCLAQRNNKYERSFHANNQSRNTVVIQVHRNVQTNYMILYCTWLLKKDIYWTK